MKISDYIGYEIFQTGTLCWLTYDDCGNKRTIATYSPNYSQAEVIKDIEANEKQIEWAKDRYIAGEGNFV